MNRTLRNIMNVTVAVTVTVAATVFAQEPVKRRAISGQPEARIPNAAGANASTVTVPGFEGAAPTDDGRIQVMIELLDAPAAVVFAEAMKGSVPSDPRARRVAASATAARISRIESAQNDVAAAISSPRIDAREMYRVQKALNGIAVAIEPERLRELMRTPGVKRVLPIYPEYTTNSTSVPFIGAPSVWANTIGLPAGADGAGIRIGIIDTGVDYMHAAFGGTGALADYQTESTDTAVFTTVGTAVSGPFPTAKVVGGYDFAGDAYTGSNAAVPDANPMDCNGHGSHVAGTAAAFGVTAAGTTFAGPFDANPATYSSLRIGPGTAPQALLYGLRVFGCAGSTGLTTLAIDWSLDPNGDTDLSDHLDIINMSLGSNFGSVTNATALASDNAALAGVIVVTSAGNAGDTFFISGAPGSASRAIATASSVDDGVTAPLIRANTPAGIAGFYTAGAAQFGSVPPPGGVTGNVVIALDPADGAGPLTTDACSPITNAVDVNGNIALVDRGTCGFAIKVKNAQDAGAIGVLVANSAAGTFGGMAGVDPTIVIPSVMITFADGNTFKTNIATLNVTLFPGADTVSSFSSRGPRRILGSPLRLKPDIAAPGQNITSVQTGKTCLVAAGCTGVADPSGYQAGNQPLNISGTSMASPHMAGIMALLRQLKPDWSVEELKALAMNYAINDTTVNPGATPPRYGPSRVGAGRVDPAGAALGNVVALSAEDAGVVSLTFQPEVTGVVVQNRSVRLVNKGLTDETYDLAFDNVVDSPGVTFSLPGGSSVIVPAGESVEIDVQMTADPALMEHTRDPALATTQTIQTNYGAQPRNFLTEEGSYLTFSQGAALQFRLPVYMAQRPASTMSANSIVTGGAPTGSTTIALSGSDLCTGTIVAGPDCTGTFPTDVVSLVTPLELHVVSGVDPEFSPGYADLQYAGTSFIPNGGAPNPATDVVVFGASTWGDWSTPGEVAFNFCVDHNEDGIYDKVVINTVPSIFVANAPFVDTFVRVIQDTTTGSYSILGVASPVSLVGPNVIDSALHLNSVLMMGATPAQMGFGAGDTTFRYRVVTCPGTNPGCARTAGGDRCSGTAFFDAAAGPFFYDYANPGLNFDGAFLAADLNGAALPVSWNTANMATNGTLGALLLHHHNKAGTRSEVVLLDTAASVDLAIAAGSAPLSPALGSNVTITVNVTNPSGPAASGVNVLVPLPPGLTWVSDSVGGDYDATTGVWTVGNVAAAGTETLIITASVDSTDPQIVNAQITDVTPLDPNPVNNQSSFVISAPRSSDLVVAMAASGATAFPGDPISYTITLTNNGVDPAYSIDVADSFPAFPALDPATATPSQGVYDMGSNTWNLAGLGNGGTATLVLGLNAPNMAGPLQSTATGTSATADPNAINNTDSETIQIVSPSNVAGTKTNTGDFWEGGTVTYTVTLTNSGSYTQQDNPGSEFTDILPSTMTLVSASATSGTATASIGTNTVDWNGSIAPSGGTVIITVTATINNTAVVGSTITNAGTINYDADGNGTNEATNPVSSNFVVISPATITATMTAAGTFQPGSNVTYTVILSNGGPADQLDNPGDEFSATLPSTMTLVSVNSSALASETALRGEPVTHAGETATWNGTIPAGGDVTITIVAQIDPLIAGGTVISYQGTANFDADGNGTNESSVLTNDPGTGAAGDATTFAVASPATIASPSKTVSTRVAGIGQTITYTIVLNNVGTAAQSDNPGDELTDVLPSALDLVSASATSGTALATIATNTVTWNGSIAAGDSVTITITATVNATASGTVLNQATVAFDSDGDGTNESTVLTDDPETSATDDPTAFALPSAIPAVSPLGMLLLSALLAGAALLLLRRVL